MPLATTKSQMATLNMSQPTVATITVNMIEEVTTVKERMNGQTAPSMLAYSKMEFLKGKESGLGRMVSKEKASGVTGTQLRVQSQRTVP